MTTSTISWRRWPLLLLTVLSCGEARSVPQRRRNEGARNTLQWHSRRVAEHSSSPRRKALRMSSSTSSGKGKGKSGSHAGYLGCLGLSSDELQQNWIFQGQAASCSYTYHSGKGKGSTNSSGKGSGKGKNKWRWWGNGGTDDSSVSGGSGGSGSSGGGGSSGGYDNSDGAGGNDGSSSSGGSGGSDSSGGNDGNSNAGGNDSGGNDDGNVDNRDGEKDYYDDDSSSPYDGQEVSNEDFGNVNESDDDYFYVKDDDRGGTGGDDAASGKADDDQYFANDDAGNDGANGGGDNDDANGGGGDDGANGDDAVDQQNIEGVNSYDPYASFDIETCDTYENLWLWDLSLSCESDISLDTCECTFAEELVEEGYITCETMASKCPSNCQICNTCAKMMGCGGFINIDSVIAQSPFFILVAAVGVLCCGMTYYYARRRRGHNSEMAAHLMMNDDDECEEPVWLAPEMPAPIMSDKEYGALQQMNPPVRPMDEPRVWLAPTAVPYDRRMHTQTTIQNVNLLADHAEVDPDGMDVLPSPSTASIYYDNEGVKACESSEAASISSSGVGDDVAENVDQPPSALDGVASYDSNGDGPSVWLAPDVVQFQPSHEAALDAGGDSQDSKTDGVWLAPVV